jgi:hypothetical protein
MSRRRYCHHFCRSRCHIGDSQQWQWRGQAMAAETEAAVGVHNNQPTNDSNSSRNSICGGSSSNGGSRGSGSGDGGNGGIGGCAEGRSGDGGM